MQWPHATVEWGDTSMENPETQDIDSDNQQNYQEIKYYSTINS